MTMKSFKLPTGVSPKNYELFFDVDLKNFKFSGKETIDIHLTKSTKEIILNSRDLKINHVELCYGKTCLLPTLKLENEKELLILHFKNKVKGPVKLTIMFEGKLTDNLTGFYRSKYMHKNSEKYLATTQFEAPYARRAFPCFDEPEYKATFDVTLKIAKNLKAVSNMPVQKERTESNKKLVTFQRTPLMSTYLLYLGVGEFEFLQSKLGNILVRIVTTPGKKNQAKFALELTKKFVSYFQKYSGIPYPLPKLDMIALADFAAGAMENWGAITFREIYLLFDPKLTSVPIKKRIAMIIAHELWHQWSGNLVTMHWWNDLWLNESFATFMAYKAVNHYFPEWKMWEEFIDDETARAFDDDSLKTTHPIEVEVENPHQIEEIFDAISYSKGGSVLRMLESYLGEELFRKGVSNYLSNNKYSNAASQDLWNSLAKVSNKPIKDLMQSWIRQAGYPVVEAFLKNQSLILQQKKFVFNHNDIKTRWMIPLIIKLNNNQIISEILDGNTKIINLNATPEWFKVNYDQNGFYRVNYPEENLSQLKWIISKLSPLDRWGVQNDLFKISVNGETTLDKYLDFIKSFGDEENYLVLGDIYSNIMKMYFVFCQQDFWPKIWNSFKNHSKAPFQKLLNKLTWEPKDGESQTDSLLRNLAIRYLAFAEDQETVRIGLEKYEQYLKKKIQLHPDLKYSVFSIAAVNGDEEVYKNLINLYSKTQSPEEKVIFLQALGQFRNPRILNKVLDFALSKQVRTQDLQIIFGSVVSNPHSRSIVMPWIKQNWKKIESYKNTGSIFLRIVESLISSQIGKDREQELRKFFRAHPVKYKITVEKSFERMRRNTAWLEENGQVLNNYFGA